MQKRFKTEKQLAKNTSKSERNFSEFFPQRKKLGRNKVQIPWVLFFVILVDQASTFFLWNGLKPGSF